MERESIELKRFEKKANGYAKALSLAPNARIFEIIAILNVINDFVLKSDTKKSKIRIVELMAGSGYLTNFLIRNGFKNIDVFEISTNMSKNIKCDGVRFHPISTLLDIDDHLKKIKPHIVVSLAGYHHLMSYNANEEIDYDQSYEYQKRITELSLKYAANNHLIIIADIFEDELLNEVQNEPIYWDNKATKLLPKDLIKNEFINNIKKSKDIRNYSNILKDYYSNTLSQENSTLAWFREVVEEYSVPGHKDVAISKSFIERLSAKYSLNYSTYITPWIFKDKKQLIDFVKSFWFTELKSNKTFKDIENYIDNNHLIRSLDNGVYSFNWQLAIITVQKKDCIKVDNYFLKGIVYLSALVLILLVSIYLKEKTLFFKANDVFEKIIWMANAILFRDLIFEKIKTLWLTKNI